MRIPAGRNAQRVDPERLHFDRLANARGHDPVADLRIHPRQLHAWHSRAQQTVVIGTNVETRATAIAGENGLYRLLQACARAVGSVLCRKIVVHCNNEP